MNNDIKAWRKAREEQDEGFSLLVVAIPAVAVPLAICAAAATATASDTYRL